MAPQTRRRIDPLGSDTYLRVRAETDRAALLGLGRPRTSRKFPINHLGGDQAAGFRASGIPLANKPQKRPTVLPSASMSIEKAAGFVPRPGMVCMSPQRATIHPAPV